MAIRILHTSDWHLGVNLERASREQEHRLFLDWLLALAEQNEVDAIVVAGDVFHVAQPSSEAQQLYYRFLANARSTGIGQVVVVGGNHDSPSRLDAPAEILSALDVHVVGGIGATAESWERCARPLRRRDGTLGASIAAVPYVHEYRLGVRTTACSPQAIAADFHAAFTRVYSHVANLCAARYPGVPMLATGHLACGSVHPDDSFAQIHQIGTIEALSPSIFDERFAYVALGHIHGCYAPVAGRVWYSGTPIPLRHGEAEGNRHVLQVDVDDAGNADITRIVVPRWRDIVAYRGDEAEVCAAIEALRWEHDLEPFVYAFVQVDANDPTLPDRVRDSFTKAHPAERRPQLVQLHQERRQAAQGEHDATQLPPLDEMRPEDVFRALHRHRHREEPTEVVMAAFRSLLGGLEGLGGLGGDASETEAA